MDGMVTGWWDWTVTISYAFGPWLLLWRVGERRWFKQALGSGLLFALIASFLDDLGVSAHLWGYPEQPLPLESGNAVWNVVAAAAEATLVAEMALARPRQVWYWVAGLAVANAGAEYLALYTTRLMRYPHWSPLYSIPVYLVILWLIVRYTWWIHSPPPKWQPPAGTER